MGYLVPILVALLSLGAADFGWTSTRPLPWAVGGLALAPYALAWAAHRLLFAGRFRAAGIVDGAIALSPVAAQMLAATLLGWPTTVERALDASVSLLRWPGPGVVAGLAPYVLYQLCAIDARARVVERHVEGSRHARSFQIRLFLSALAPFALYLSISMLVALDDGLRVHVEEIALLNAAFTALLVAIFVVFLPFLLRNTWDTVPIERGWIRSLLEDVARATDFRCRELLLWRTGNQMANAAIVGFTPRSRIVLLSDALLSHLGPRELAAVFAHEIGHAKRHHALIFGGFALFLFVGADLIFTRAGIEGEGLALTLFGAVLLLWFLSFGWLSRRFELEADLVSVEVMGGSRPLIDALEHVSGAHARRKKSWRHFSVHDRVAFLERVERDPTLGVRLRRKLRRWSVVGLCLTVVVLGLELFELTRAVDAERVVAQLRLGRYEEAAARVARGADVDEHLRELATRAAGVPPEARGQEELEARARESLARADAPAARALLELAALRSESDAGAAADALDVLALLDDGETEAARERLAHVAPEWRRLLVPLVPAHER